MAYVDFLSSTHKITQRDYLARVNDPDYPKEQAAELAKKYGFDYWDGDRRINYGGYNYDGRWKSVAQAMVAHYDLTSTSRILDVGCGKGFLLYDFTLEVPGIKVQGIDVSEYAIENSKKEIREFVQIGNANSLPFENNHFDLVISITTLHNLYCYDLDLALREIERVGKNNKYLCVESYRNEMEKTNLLYWQVTCEAFNTPEEWQWWFKHTGYTGDYSFIYFE